MVPYPKLILHNRSHAIEQYGKCSRHHPLTYLCNVIVVHQWYIILNIYYIHYSIWYVVLCSVVLPPLLPQQRSFDTQKKIEHCRLLDSQGDHPFRYTSSLYIIDRQVYLLSYLQVVLKAEIYIQSAPNNSNDSHSFMCLGSSGCFGQHYNCSKIQI